MTQKRTSDPSTIERQNKSSFDVIVIGSGIGGLTTAAILAKFNHKRVLVLEKHFQPGGLTHEFQRGKFSWDVGLHYVGEMAPKTLPRNIFDYITDGALKWQQMPDVFERFVYPEFSFEVPSDPEEYQRKIQELFPKERAAIHTYFRDIQRAAAWNRLALIEKSLPAFIALLVRLYRRRGAKMALLTLGVYLDEHFENPRLKALLASQWGDYGVPPRDAAFVIHALIVNHYLQGGYFPEGGASNIAKAVRPIIERQGGAMLVGHSVSGLIVENGIAIGVTATYESGSEIKEVSFYAPVVISDTGAAETYKNLLKQPMTATKGLSAVTIYLGLKDTPEQLGVHGENVWIFSSYDHGRMAEDSEAFLLGNPPYCYVSFPSLKTSCPRSHTAEIIAFLDYDIFLNFKNKPWFSRDADYYALKDTLAKGLVEFVDKSIPGFKNLVVYSEVSTPLSLETFTSRTRGLMYGVPATPDRYRTPQLGIWTPIKGFYLTGSDIASLGIVGAMMGGVLSAAVINGPLGFFKIMKAVKKYGDAAPFKVVTDEFPKARPLSNEISARLVTRTLLSSHYYEIAVEVSDSMGFVPGQHCYLEFAYGEWRPYSIVSSINNTVTFVIDSSPRGVGSRFTVEAPLGSIINLRLPTGVLRVHDSKNQDLVFIATGSGVTPFFSMIQSLSSTARSQKRVTLLWGIHDVSDEFSARYLGKARKQMNLSVIPCVSEPAAVGSCYSGTVTARVREMQIDFRDTDFYLCGNPVMIAEMHSWLRNKNASNIYFEM